MCILEQNSIFHTKRAFSFTEAKVFMKLLNATSCHYIINTVVIFKTQGKVASLKLSSSLYVACPNRERELEELSAHENHAYPP